MKKLISSLVSATLLLSLILIVSPSFAEETKNYSRLYNQFLRNLERQNSSDEVGGQAEEVTVEPTVDLQEEPAAPAASEISMVGKVYRNENGNYFIRQEDKAPGMLDYRVYGTELSNEIVGSVVFDRVQLLGTPAYYNGAMIGISVTQLVVLSSDAPEAEVVAPPVVQDPVVVMPDSDNFTGSIFIQDGRAYLLSEGVTRLLLNGELWRMAFENAWKGEVTVTGYLTPNGGLYYYNITR